MHIAPLATFRVLFGGIMLISILRFMLNGWVYDMYIQPNFFFGYFGFEWVKPLEGDGMYVVFVLMAVASLLIMLGLFYRVAAVSFFLLFTYVELLDKTNYLNHYYFVSIVAFLMIWVPANRWFSLDVLRNPALRQEMVPRWTVGLFRLQLGMVYFFAGVAKIQGEWLLRAMPLTIWLPAKANMPLIGGLLKWKAAAYIFSWFGMLYDLTVPFLLSWKRTRFLAYFAVIGFHLMTYFLFQIGMFPFIMILCTLIFFPAEDHRRAVDWISGKFARFSFAQSPSTHSSTTTSSTPFSRSNQIVLSILALHFFIQILLPFRYLLYKGDLFWHEQGFRFSWRVMLMEKAGYAIMHVRDPETGRSGEVTNGEYLTPNQEKMMATQPDMILQYAHFLEEDYQKQGIANPEIYAEVYVTLNGSGSRPFTDARRDLTKEIEGFHQKDWVLPFEVGKKQTVEKAGGEGK
ncbi:MAG: HTTM domain-containing protein [Bacteroidota bacterium]